MDLDPDHPLIKIALDKIEKYTADADIVIDDVESSYVYAVFMFDFEFLETIKKRAKDVLDNLRGYIASQEARYQRMIGALNKFGEYETDDLEVLLWDLKRPIIYRIQRLEQLLESINKVFT